jgi:hypothetical protein
MSIFEQYFDLSKLKGSNPLIRVFYEKMRNQQYDGSCFLVKAMLMFYSNRLTSKDYLNYLKNEVSVIKSKLTKDDDKQDFNQLLQSILDAIYDNMGKGKPFHNDENLSSFKYYLVDSFFIPRLEGSSLKPSINIKDRVLNVQAISLMPVTQELFQADYRKDEITGLLKCEFPRVVYPKNGWAYRVYPLELKATDILIVDYTDKYIYPRGEEHANLEIQPLRDKKPLLIYRCSREKFDDLIQHTPLRHTPSDFSAIVCSEGASLLDAVLPHCFMVDGISMLGANSSQTLLHLCLMLDAVVNDENREILKRLRISLRSFVTSPQSQDAESCIKMVFDIAELSGKVLSKIEDRSLRSLLTYMKDTMPVIVTKKLLSSDKEWLMCNTLSNNDLFRLLTIPINLKLLSQVSPEAYIDDFANNCMSKVTTISKYNYESVRKEMEAILNDFNQTDNVLNLLLMRVLIKKFGSLLLAGGIDQATVLSVTQDLSHQIAMCWVRQIADGEKIIGFSLLRDNFHKCREWITEHCLSLPLDETEKELFNQYSTQFSEDLTIQARENFNNAVDKLNEEIKDDAQPHISPR